jgi:hypothetical protein
MELLKGLYAILYFSNLSLPGPFPIPIVGTIPQFLISAARGRTAAQQLLDLKKRYGRVYTIWIGPLPAVLVCDYELMVENFVKNGDAFAGRWRPYLPDKSRGRQNASHSIYCWYDLPN